jgi:glycosyltransferase involved in cell wall biosynthesis
VRKEVEPYIVIDANTSRVIKNEKNRMDQKPTVSVVMITYNHEKYIAEAMNGVFMQKCDFDIEFIIANDKSTDETDRKILECLSEVSIPQNIKIEYANHEQNKGVSGNFIWALQQANGKYIALCEGDDYWTDPLKLKKQVDFLEKNEKYNLVTSYITRYNQNENLFIEPKKMKAYSFDYKDMVEKNHSPTCVSVIRNEIEKGFEFIEGRGTDSQLWLRVLGKNKKAYKFGTSMAVYRKHDGGVSSITHQSHKTYRNRKKYALRKIEKAKFWNTYFDHTANESVKKVKIKIYKYIVSLAKRENKIRDLVFYSFRYFLLKLS